MSSLDPTSFDAIAFEFDTDVQAFFGTTTTYFSHATLSKDVGFIQMTHDAIRFTPNFYEDASVATMSPAPGDDNAATFTATTGTVPAVTLSTASISAPTYIDMRKIPETANLLFNKNEWQYEVCGASFEQFDVTSCSYIDG